MKSTDIYGPIWVMVLNVVNSPSCQVSYKVPMFDVGSYDLKKNYYNHLTMDI